MRQHKEYVVMKIYICIHIMATLIVGLRTIIDHKPYGEAGGMHLELSRFSIALILLIQICTLGLTYVFFLLTKNNRVRLSKKKTKFEINKNRADKFIFIILIVQLIFSLKTGNGRLGYEVQSSFSPILNLLDISSFFPIYFFCCRGRKLYWYNVVIFCIWKLLCGWTGFVMTIAFYELYILIRENAKSIISKINSNAYYVTSILAILIGGGIYSILFRVKTIIREHFDPGILSYYEGLNNLVLRFTNFPVSLVGIQEHTRIAELSRIYNNWYTEVILTFRSLIPGFIWKNKGELRAFGNLVLLSIYPTLGTGTSTGYLCWAYWYNILESSVLMFVFYFIALLFFFQVSKNIIYAFEDEKNLGLLDFLYFEMIFKVFNGAALESTFGYGYIGMIYILPVMILLGIIRIRKVA